MDNSRAVSICLSDLHAVPDFSRLYMHHQYLCICFVHCNGELRAYNPVRSIINIRNDIQQGLDAQKKRANPDSRVHTYLDTKVGTIHSHHYRPSAG